MVSRRGEDAALRSLPEPKPKGRRGPQATCGKDRINLKVLAGQTRGWEEVECVQYGEKVTKMLETFPATWPPAGGVIRVVIVKEGDRLIPFFSGGVLRLSQRLHTGAVPLDATPSRRGGSRSLSTLGERRFWRAFLDNQRDPPRLEGGAS